ncbi:ABC transporter substrate-binding protein [Pseudotabrizicola sp. 4114]|uniref:ABC transporter substrate-binding protein n=1 Tax=Pseudotabrizicola sp. 4114 TaxID=2817731 RepID=UPI00285CB68F|nr:peptide/nickel transport system substrate-binding protein [Pseudorhodobacter sp. 4114]
MKTLLGALLISAAMGNPVLAETIRWARMADALSLDPHATNQGITAGFLHHVYETLVDTDAEGNLVPRLATEWMVKDTSPDTWVFKLRPDVTFHDGAAFTAEDVVFSINRARSEGSLMRSLHGAVVDVVAVDDLTVEVKMAAPSPIYPRNLTNTFMMDLTWAEANNVVKVQDFTAGEDNYAVRNTNGTGPYVLTSREPEVRSMLTLNEKHWAETSPGITDIEYLTIADPATRTAALLSGEVDLILDMPVQDIERISAADGVKVVTGPENRVIYFSYRIGQYLHNEGAGEMSPFTDLKVREAVDLAVDRDAIRQIIMRGQSIPTDVVAPPFVNGWTEEIATYSKPDVERAKALLAEAGYPDGFSITLDTPNNRYVNDEAISQAVVGMLARVGIRVSLQSRPMAQHSQYFQSGESDFFLMGWGVPTFDSAYTFSGLMHTRTDTAGLYNPVGYSNPELDAMIDGIETEMDIEKRNAMIAEAWAIIEVDRPVLAIHTQSLAYGMRENVNVAIHPGDMPRMYQATID